VELGLKQWAEHNGNGTPTGSGITMGDHHVLVMTHHHPRSYGAVIVGEAAPRPPQAKGNDMTVTTTKLSRAAGLAAVVAGLLFIIIQPIHPPENLASVTGTSWAVVASITLAFSILGLVGASGIYLRQVKEAGVLGLVGYVMYAAFFLLTSVFTFAEMFILPPLASQAPQFVTSFLGIFSGTSGGAELGALGAFGAVGFGVYLVGGSVFGIALFRARVLARWAALALVFASMSTLLIPLLPHSLGRYAAVPMGIALIGLGYSLWSDQRVAVVGSVPDRTSRRLDLATAE